MTAHHDLDRQLDAFLTDGPTRLPDASFDAVRDRTEQTSQRVVLGPWRFPEMNKLLAIGVGAAAVIAVLLVGPNLLPSSSSGPGAAPFSVDPSGAPSAEPSEAPSAEPTASPDGFLPVGPYTVVDLGAPDAPVDITLEIPASGWKAHREFGAIQKGDDRDAPEAAILAWSFPAGTGIYVYEDPCAWTTSAPDAPVTTVDAFAAALAAQPSRAGTQPVDVTVGEYAGKLVTLRVPDDVPRGNEGFDDCDREMFATYGTSTTEPSRNQQDAGQIDDLWILDVDGAIVVIDAMYRADTPDELLEEMRTIAESATFDPR